MNNLVSLSYLDSYNVANIEECLRASMEELKLFGKLRPKMKVLIKPSLPVSESQDKAKTTHPAIVRAIVNILSKMGVTCVVADSPYKKYSRTNLDQVYLNTGMLEVANLTTCELNRNLKTFKMDIPNGIKAKHLTLLDVVNDVDAIINVGKININENLGYMGACSNLFGLIPGELKSIVLNRLSTLKDYNHYLLDMYHALKNKIAFNILDGIVALEHGEVQRMLYCLGVSENMFSLDASILDILNIKHENTILKQANEREFINIDKPYKLVGEDIEKFKVQDFVLNEVCQDTKINPSDKAKAQYFKSNQQRVKIEPNKCKGCSVCMKACPTGAIMMKYDKNGELYASIDYSKCVFCFKCHETCPYKVVEVETPQKYKALKKDFDKYNYEQDT